jgi:hypothetical protein
VADVNE